MWPRYDCPSCETDLQATPPRPVKHPWYKFVTRHTLQCPACGIALEKRFADFDMSMLTICSIGGLSSLWGAGKVVLPVVASLFAARLLIGLFLSAYTIKQTARRTND